MTSDVQPAHLILGGGMVLSLGGAVLAADVGMLSLRVPYVSENKSLVLRMDHAVLRWDSELGPLESSRLHHFLDLLAQALGHMGYLVEFRGALAVDVVCASVMV